MELYYNLVQIWTNVNDFNTTIIECTILKKRIPAPKTALGLVSTLETQASHIFTLNLWLSYFFILRLIYLTIEFLLI